MCEVGPFALLCEPILDMYDWHHDWRNYRHPGYYECLPFSNPPTLTLWPASIWKELHSFYTLLWWRGLVHCHLGGTSGYVNALILLAWKRTGKVVECAPSGRWTIIWKCASSGSSGNKVDSLAMCGSGSSGSRPSQTSGSFPVSICLRPLSIFTSTCTSIRSFPSMNRGLHYHTHFPYVEKVSGNFVECWAILCLDQLFEFINSCHLCNLNSESPSIFIAQDEAIQIDYLWD